uniref:Uncharacterized protein n=1 Tax=Knipowitschia caucasica TaxID=637954 RepID=A0AAV2JNY2_KNICA
MEGRSTDVPGHCRPVHRKPLCVQTGPIGHFCPGPPPEHRSRPGLTSLRAIPNKEPPHWALLSVPPALALSPSVENWVTTVHQSSMHTSIRLLIQI